MSLAPYPKYRPSGIERLGEVPEHWEIHRLKDVATIRFSNVDKKIVDGERPVRLCNYVDVYYNDYLSPALNLMEATATQAEIEKFALDVGDVVITKDSEDWTDIGVPSLVVETATNMVCGYHLALLRPRVRLNGRHLLRVIQSAAVSAQLSMVATGVTRFALSKAAISNARVPLPPVDEQRDIAAFLDTQTGRHDALLRKQQTLIERLREKRSALITETVTRGLPPDAARAAGLDPNPPRKPSGIEWLGDLPVHWEVRRLRHFLTRNESGVWGEDADSNGTPVLRSTEQTVEGGWRVREPAIRRLADAERSRYRLERGDLVVTTSSGSARHIGKTSLVTESVERLNACFSNFMQRLRCSASLEPRLAYYLLNSPTGREQLVFHSSTTTGLANLNGAVLSNVWLAVPPAYPEQQAIADYLDRETAKLDALVAKIETAVERLREYRSALITAAVTGKVDVRSARQSAPPEERPAREAPRP